MQATAQQLKFFSNLKKKLPKQFARQISAKLDGISNRQVQMVFKTEITNPAIVKMVVDAATLLAEEYREIFKNNVSKKPIRRKKKLSSTASL